MCLLSLVAALHIFYLWLVMIVQWLLMAIIMCIVTCGYPWLQWLPMVTSSYTHGYQWLLMVAVVTSGYSGYPWLHIVTVVTIGYSCMVTVVTSAW